MIKVIGFMIIVLLTIYFFMHRHEETRPEVEYIDLWTAPYKVVYTDEGGNVMYKHFYTEDEALEFIYNLDKGYKLITFTRLIKV